MSDDELRQKKESDAETALAEALAAEPAEQSDLLCAECGGRMFQIILTDKPFGFMLECVSCGLLTEEK